jgi:hypothetical protein
VIGCATCGAPPIGSFNDGSPRWGPDHPDHEPVRNAAAAPWDGARLVVELTPDEMAEAVECGQARFKKAGREKRKDYLGEPSPDAHVLGAQGERVFSKWLGLPWDCTMNGFGGAADVAGCQIRTVPFGRPPRLKVKDNDPDRRPCVLIVSSAPRFWIRGWIMAKDARKPEWTDDPGGRGKPQHFVPAAFLRPMTEFLDVDAVRAAMGKPPRGA